MYICIYVSMYPCIYVSIYLCIYVSLYLCIYVSMYAWVHACMHACMHVVCECTCTCILFRRCSLKFPTGFLPLTSKRSNQPKGGNSLSATQRPQGIRQFWRIALTIQWTETSSTVVGLKKCRRIKIQRFHAKFCLAGGPGEVCVVYVPPVAQKPDNYCFKFTSPVAPLGELESIIFRQTAQCSSVSPQDIQKVIFAELGRKTNETNSYNRIK